MATRVLSHYVLVKQVMRSKSGVIITEAAKADEDKYNFSFTILQKGPKCETDIQIGEHPIFGKFVTFSGVKVVEKNKLGMVTELIIHENDIIGVDDEMTELSIEPEKTELN